MFLVPGIAAKETSLQLTTAAISRAPQHQVHQSDLFATFLLILPLEEQLGQPLIQFFITFAFLECLSN